MMETSEENVEYFLSGAEIIEITKLRYFEHCVGDFYIKVHCVVKKK
jgi:hypothetical protein